MKKQKKIKIKQRIKRLRSEFSLTQNTLGLLINRSQTTIARWEKLTDILVPNAFTLQEIVTAINRDFDGQITLEYFYGD